MSRSSGPGELIAELAALGVRLWEDDGRLRYRAPAGVLTEQWRESLRAQRDAVLDALRATQGPVAEPHPEQRHDEFPVTDVQAAYLFGRRDAFTYGGVGCHGYGELEIEDLDLDRLRTAWQGVVERHDMLRAVIDPNGSQRVLEQMPEYRIEVDVVADAELDSAVARTRAGLDHRVYRPDEWPLFALRVTSAPRVAVLHFSIDFLICDFISIQVVLDELYSRYHRPERRIEPLEITFRDYLLAETKLHSGPRYEQDRDYWLGRLDELPPAPELPVTSAAEDSPPRFSRWETALNPREWAALRERAGRHGVTPSGAVLACYAEAIATWSRAPRFCLDITLLNRQPLHPQVNELVGDFTSVSLLAARHDPSETFRDRAVRAQATLWADLDHRLFSGIDVLREQTRRRGGVASLMPVVFTSAIGVGEAPAEGFGDPVYGISQTPQVWIDCQNIERGGGLATNWDVRDGVFPDGLIDDMFAAYTALLRRLGASDDAWEENAPIPLPAAQSARRELVNATEAPIPAGLLHEGLLTRAYRTPDAVAVIAEDRTLTYRELVGRAAAVAESLLANGCAPGELVAVVAEKGWRQIVAVLGALLAGGVYVPIDTGQPPARRDTILANAGIRLVLTDADVDQSSGPMPERMPEPRVVADGLAYVIHTSGSTGTPKGVMITHRAALNTVRDINERFAVTEADRVLGLANLGFDLSVYDIFGPLAVGACLVLPSPRRRGDPAHWADLVRANEITLWNSVPAQLQMLSDYLRFAPDRDLPTLRIALLSGDWIPVTLPDEIRASLPGLRLISLGGATEASIWSIYHPIDVVDPALGSIPYGKPLANQTFHVLDDWLAPRPDWVTGELYIGGVGLADGYLGDAERTAERFLTDPATGARLYRTGDLGRYRPDGEIEFLGREDFQVKIRGHRIELAEIDAAIGTCPAAAGRAVLVDGTGLSRRLVAFVEPARTDAPPPTDDPSPAAIRAGEDVLRGNDVPGYLSYLRVLDEVALRVMLDALRAAGLFTNPDDRHTEPEIQTGAGVARRHRRLVRRMLGALVEGGRLALDERGYRLVDEGAAPDWTQVTELAALAGDSAELMRYFRASAEHLPALLRGESDPLTLLFPEGRVDTSDALYADALFNRWANGSLGAIVAELAARPGAPVRVLEVGAGAGGTTAAVLDALAGSPVDYLYTDLSPFFLGEGRARFGDRLDVSYARFDLHGDPRAQGLLPNSIDIVVAGDVLHTTRDVTATVAKLRELLVPGGWLVFVEMTRDHYQIMTSLELLVNLDADELDFTDLRQGTDRTFLDLDQWRAVLDEAGAELAVCLPVDGDPLTEVGIRVFAARVKTDRAPLDPGELDAHLRTLLPDYMVPASIQIVDALPHTDNGKLDRATLTRWLGTTTVATTTDDVPSTDLQRRLSAIWAEVFGIPEVGVTQNFFDLGGDSLQAAKLTGQIIDEIPEADGAFFDELLRYLLEHPTVAMLADHLSGGTDTGPAPGVAATGTVLTPLGGSGGERYLVLGEPDDDLLAALREWGTVLGVRGGADERLLVADAASAALAQAGNWHVVGAGAAALAAVEVAQQLAEGGVDAGLTVIEPLGEPPTYAGDVTLVLAPEADTGEWPDACLGELTVRRLSGSRAAALAEALREED